MKLRNALPQKLKDCSTVHVLERSLEKNQLPHSLLFHSQEMVVLENVAYALATELLETSSSPFKHPDCFVLRPGNKMRGIGADETRELIRELHQSSSQGGVKIAIIYEADRMNTTAANIFLKTLEEPPIGTVIVLLSVRPYRLLETTRSRTVAFHFPAIQITLEDENWKKWLNDYRKWLESIQGLTNTSKQYAFSIFTIYGLLSRFQTILEQLGATAWEKEQDKLPTHLSNEQKVAFETGALKSVRRQLFMEIEEHTYSCMKVNDQEEQENMSCINVLSQSIACLERVNGLLEVNLNEITALEHFFLVSANLWKEHREYYRTL